MQFTVPQFIYREARILGPLTFKQVIYIGIGGIICFVIYLIIGKQFIVAFIAASIFVMIVSALFAFGQYGGKTLPIIISNFFTFTLSSRLYLWRRKTFSPRIVMTKVVRKEDKRQAEAPLKIATKSRLRELSAEIEIK